MPVTTKGTKPPPKKKVEVKTGRGGARAGAGRKSDNKIEGETKEPITVRLYPTQREALEKKFGSVQSALDSIPLE